MLKQELNLLREQVYNKSLTVATPLQVFFLNFFLIPSRSIWNTHNTETRWFCKVSLIPSHSALIKGFLSIIFHKSARRAISIIVLSYIGHVRLTIKTLIGRRYSVFIQQRLKLTW